MTDEPVESTAVEEPAEEAPVEEPSNEIARVEPPQGDHGVTLFGTTEPAAVVEAATAVADALKPVLTTKDMLTKIQGRDHVNVEGWQTLGTMLGVFPVVVKCEPVGVSNYKVHETRKKWGGPKGKRVITETIERDYEVVGNDWKAEVEARTIDGRIVGSGIAYCKRTESTWAERDDYALASMAQTRATSKALKSVLGFVVNLAGYTATPAEEMPSTEAPPTEPPFGPPASDELIGTVTRALDYMGLNLEGFKAVREEITKRSDGYFPQIAGQAIVLVAAQLRTATDAAMKAAAEQETADAGDSNEGTDDDAPAGEPEAEAGDGTDD